MKTQIEILLQVSWYNMNEIFKNMKYIVYVTQIGFDFIIPIIFCTLFGKFLTNILQLNNIFVVIFILLGFFSGGYSAIKRLKSVFSGKSKNDEKKD